MKHPVVIQIENEIEKKYLKVKEYFFLIEKKIKN